MTEPPIRTVIIDDQAAMRHTLANLLEAERDVQVVGCAANGEEGLKVVFQTKPDVILLDLEMPRMDGFAFLRLLMAKQPTPVVVVSSHTGRDNVFRALELGALEFVAKPLRQGGGLDADAIRAELLDKVRLSRRLEAVHLTERARRQSAEIAKLRSHTAPGPAAQARGDAALPDWVLCIGASTGGPSSILTLLLTMDPQWPMGILITQHMPERFARAFAERLDRATPWTVREAEPGTFVRSGHALVASDSWSLRVARDRQSLRVLPPLPGESRAQGYVPSVDRMLEAAAMAVGSQLIAVILSGMSGDGVRGAQAVRMAGGRVLVEAPESAIVPGMPEEVIRAGAVDEVVPLANMAPVIGRHIASSIRKV
ncbi:MAG: chemotaxis-specific protein-glutamate methyltransferase CheB [Myxococcota bacterium]|nr:chemotaxis-specific protein-glutamate methyltransferase CheB [Myxococcota bacterium]